MATVIRRGKPVEIDDQIPRWRRKMRRFKALRRQLLEILLEKLGTYEAVETWLNTAQEGLGGAKPRQFVNPRQIKGLIKYVKNV